MSELDPYDYYLPKELIAQHPLQRRSDARLLVVHRSTNRLEHAHVRDLPRFLDPGDFLVLNNTKVLPARLVGRRERTGARWSGLYLTSDNRGAWQVISKTRGKLEPGEVIVIESWDRRYVSRLRLLAQLEGGRWAVKSEGDEHPFDFLQRFGRVPLPPYIRDGEMIETDRATYQTIFAKIPGAVAAPTAGLHFTAELLQELAGRGIDHGFVTLHVGIGTFRPISAERLEEHVMHREWASVAAPVVGEMAAARARGRRVVAVGTTVVRALEAAAAQSPGELQPWQGETDLFIRPPYEFRAIDAVLTNFHLPKSTLLILVRAFGGDSLIRRAYDDAILEQYRFFSYGDAMLIL